MELHSGMTDYKAIAKEKYALFIKKCIPLVFFVFIIRWLYRGFVNDYGFAGKSLSEVLMIITVETFFVIEHFAKLNFLDKSIKNKALDK